MPEETIGFIGLGIMGGPMAGNLLRAGYSLVVHNRTWAKEEELVSALPRRTRLATWPRDVTCSSRCCRTRRTSNRCTSARTG